MQMAMLIKCSNICSFWNLHHQCFMWFSRCYSVAINTIAQHSIFLPTIPHAHWWGHNPYSDLKWAKKVTSPSCWKFEKFIVPIGTIQTSIRVAFMSKGYARKKIWNDNNLILQNILFCWGFSGCCLSPSNARVCVTRFVLSKIFILFSSNTFFRNVWEF